MEQPLLLGCRGGGVKHQLKNFLFTLFFGWWGFPVGLVMAPVRLIRNVVAICRPTDPASPSNRLRHPARHARQ